ncbi:MAG: hypothetical protein KAV99_08225 [Candidatus Latescibacteria bacterium]|nr:hypothetical protein [Candidatus Latescibacterota bacterium]
MIFKLFGVYLIIDGLASLYVFRKQAWYYQAVRLGRTLIGIILLFLGG